MILTYHKEQNWKHEEFVQDLFEEFDLINNPKKDLCFNIAYNQNHSEGYRSVYDKFSELVELIKWFLI